MRKFSVGDRVLAGRHTGVIVKINIGHVYYDYEYLVKFDNTSLIPPEMEFLDHQLSLFDENSGICPLCKNHYKITKSIFIAKTWYDCLTCKKTKEKIMSQLA